MRSIRGRAIGFLVFAVATASGQDAPPIARYVPSVPDPAHVFVLDSAHLLSRETLQALQDSARALQTETSADVAWVTLPTLGGRPIEEAALYIGRTWRIGSAGKPGDPLRNRGLVILFVPDKRTTAGPNFRIEVGNGLEGTITDSRSRAISAAMRNELRAKHYDAAYMDGWRAAAALVREDFASNTDSARAVAQAAEQARAAQPQPIALNQTSDSAISSTVVAIAVVLVGLIAMIISVRRNRARYPGSSRMYIPLPVTNDDDDVRRQNTWFSSGGGFGGSSFDSGSSSSDGGSFGGGGGFSGGGSSDTI